MPWGLHWRQRQGNCYNFQAGQSYMLKLSFKKAKQIRANMEGGDPRDDENIYMQR